jgi:hypothetical protein
MHERVLGLDQHDVGDVVELLGDVAAGVAAADDDDHGTGRGLIGHCHSCQVVDALLSRSYVQQSIFPADLRPVCRWAVT